MRVFVTGASGHIGSAVVPELIAAGHQVTGLARSDSSAGVCAAAGAAVLPGTIDDLDLLRSAAADADVAHAEHLIKENAVRRLPVVDDGQIVGIVSMGDLAASGTEDHSPLAEVSKAEPNT